MVAFSGLNLATKFSKIQKSCKNQKKKKNAFKFLISEKNIYMYAGPPKIAQELFFLSHPLRVCSSNGRKYFVVEEHWYVQLSSSELWAWAETKTGIFLGRIKTKVVRCSIYKQQSKTNRWESMYPGIWGFNRTSILSCISNKLEIGHRQKLVQHHQHIWNPVIEHFKVGAICQA